MAKFTMSDFIEGIISGKYNDMANNIHERRKFRDTINGFVIDTVFADDIGKEYETAIWIENEDIDMKIVEDYDTYEECKIGHEKWCELAKNNKIDFENIKDIYE